jgi:hypothetical protein
MNNRKRNRHQLIKTLTARRDDKSADMAIILWEKLADCVILMIGEEVFKSLYGRSIILNVSKFSWLSGCDSKSEIGNQLIELKICFNMQTPELIKEANNYLLISLTDILALLIGESLTKNILCKAWAL